MRIKDTEQVQEIKKELMLAVGNTDTDDPRHITLEQIKDFSTTNVQQGLEYLGNSLDRIEVAINNTETWTFELEDGTTITKEILVK
jgi:hypothetical protein